MSPEKNKTRTLPLLRRIVVAGLLIVLFSLPTQVALGEGQKSVRAAITTTFYSISSQDGWILESGENTNAGGTMSATAPTLRLGDDVARKQYESILSFSTARLPDAALISKVTLKFQRQSVIGNVNPVTAFQGFMVDIRKGTFHLPALQLADWKATANVTTGPFVISHLNGWYSIDLTSAKTAINKKTTGSGLTQIRLRFQLNDNNNSAANILIIYSGNAASLKRPQLIVRYSLP